MKNFRKSLTTALLGAVVVSFGAVAPVVNAYSAEYAVIVSAENKFSASEAEMKNAVKRIYLKQQTKWPNGIAGVPFSRGETSEQTAFNKSILGMDNAAYSDYWVKMKQTEGSVAPRSVEASSILMRQVTRKPGAFSVVSTSDALPGGVRVLFRFK